MLICPFAQVDFLHLPMSHPGYRQTSHKSAIIDLSKNDDEQLKNDLKTEIDQNCS